MGVDGVLLLCCIWALMRCPAARALINESSPAMTEATIILANRRALCPGLVG